MLFHCLRKDLESVVWWRGRESPHQPAIMGLAIAVLDNYSGFIKGVTEHLNKNNKSKILSIGT